MKVRGNATYKYVFPKTQCYEDFSMKFLYDMTYKFTETDRNLLYIQMV